MIDLDLAHDRPGFSLRLRCRTDARCIGVIGPSGAGKTTLLSILAGLTRPTRGRIEVDGRRLTDTGGRLHVPAHRRGAGVVFQDSRLFPHLSVRRNLQYGQPDRHTPLARAELAGLAEALDIDHLLGKPAWVLSGGEQRRAALARALLSRPGLLLLDEPLTGLDSRRRCAAMAVIRSMAAGSRMRVIIVSHAMQDLLTLTSDLMVIERGRMAGCGRYGELLCRPSTAPALVEAGLVNVLPLRVAHHLPGAGITRFAMAVAAPPDRLISGPSLPGAPEGCSVVAAFGAQDVAIASAPVEHISVQNQLPGRIVRLVACRGRRLCVVDVGVPVVAELSGMGVQHLELEEGRQVRCLIKAQALVPTLIDPTDRFPTRSRCTDPVAVQLAGCR